MHAEREPAPPGTARVVRPVDGDTIVVDIDGAEESVRLIGIDTPESVAQDRPVECYGPEAKERTAELLPAGTLVRLERDVEARDRYDRLLAYVIRDDDDIFVNRLLVEEGFAESIAYPPNTTRQGELDQAEAQRPRRPAGPVGDLRGHRRAARARVASVAVTSLAERLGYGPDDRLLIINCDDLGSCHAANVGTYEALREGIATSATLMVPCPWARDAASRYRGEDVGVHLTLNAEHDRYRWGPITHAPSLLDGDGGFPRTVTDVWDHADLDEVRRELRAQVERAILWGFDVSHLDSHMGTLQLRPEFFDVYLDLAVEFGLPLRLSGASSERAIGFPFRRLAAEERRAVPRPLRDRARRRRVAPHHREGRARPPPGRHRGVHPPRRRRARAAGARRRLAGARRRPRARHPRPQPAPDARPGRRPPHRLSGRSATCSAPHEAASPSPPSRRVALGVVRRPRAEPAHARRPRRHRPVARPHDHRRRGRLRPRARSRWRPAR